MPEMPADAKAMVTSAPYRLLASRVLLPWILRGEVPVGEGLEIGAGSGAMSARLLAKFSGIRMIATDYDPDLVTVAERNLARFGSRVSVQRADASELPFEDNRFGFVFSAAMLHHVVAWEQAIAEAVRVLRPGGVLIGYDLLNTGPIRLMHLGGRDHGDGHRAAHHDGREHHGGGGDDEVLATRMLRPSELEALLAGLPVTGAWVRIAVGGLTVRFTATKTT